MGADVIVTEIDPFKGLEAVMDGFRVMPMERSRAGRRLLCDRDRQYQGDSWRTLCAMKDGAIVCNSGHFNVELDIPALEKLSRETRIVRSGVEQYTLNNGRRVSFLGEGRLVNWPPPKGIPPASWT